MSNQASFLFDIPGPKAIRRHRIIGVVGTLLILALVAWLVWGLRSQLTPAKWMPFLDPGSWSNYLVPGILNTLQAAAISVVTASVLGLVLALGRMSSLRLLSIIATVLIEFFRAVPVLMMMLFVYFLTVFVPAIAAVVPAELKPLVGVVAGLTFYNAAVMAELLRSGINSLPRGQTEAGLALGLSMGQTRRAILIPQAITAMLPALVSQLVVILKDSALGYIINYPELLRQSQTLAARHANSIAAFIIAAILFILINWSLTTLANYLEKHMRTRQSGGMLDLSRMEADTDDTAPAR